MWTLLLIVMSVPFDWGSVSADAPEVEVDSGIPAGEPVGGGWASVAASSETLGPEDGGWVAVAASALDQAPPSPSASQGQETALLSFLEGPRLRTLTRKGRPNALLREALGEVHPRPPAPRHVVGSHAAGQVAVGVDDVGHASPAGGELLKCLVVEKCVTFAKKPRLGYNQGSLLSKPFAACVHFAKQPDAILDAGLIGVADIYCDSDKFYLTSSKARCAQLKMSGPALNLRLARLANAQCLQQRFDRQVMEQRLAQSLPKQSLLCYIDSAAYDETPMLTTVRGDCVSGVDTQRPHVPGPAPKVLQYVRHLESQVKSEAMVAKLLQTKQTSGMLVKLGDSSFAALIGETICPLQVMERTTAEVLRECLLRNSGASPWANSFFFKARAVCSDKAGSNARAERSIASDRGPSWATLLTPCDVHATSAVHKHAFHNLLPHHVSGMIHCALSLRHGAAMTVFRTCLREVIRARLKIMQGGRLSAQALAYKNHIFQLFLSGGANALVKKVLLAGLPNGDWRNFEFVEYYPPPGVDASGDKDTIAELLSSGLCWALCEAKPSLWPRHRWCGADLSLDSIGRLEAIHGLLSATYPKFVARYSRAPPCASTSLSLAACSDEAPAARCDLVPLVDTAAVAVDVGPGHEGVAADFAPVAPTEGAPVKNNAAEDESWAAANAKDRELTMQWIRQAPLGHLILMRQAMEPLRVLFHDQFSVASLDWEMHQRAEEARAMESGVAFQRSFRMLVAAEGELEGKLFEELAGLFTKEHLWDVIPVVNHTVGFNCTAFRLLSRIGCATEQLLAHPHRQFPYRMFKLLRHPALAGELAAAKYCQKDVWSQSLQEAFPTLCSEEFQATLALHAHLQWTDISGIEARHASIRRQLVARSVQTCTLDIRWASAEWVFQNIRRSAAPPMTSKGVGHMFKKAHQKATERIPCMLQVCVCVCVVQFAMVFNQWLGPQAAGCGCVCLYAPAKQQGHWSQSRHRQVFNVTPSVYLLWVSSHLIITGMNSISSEPIAIYLPGQAEPRQEEGTWLWWQVEGLHQAQEPWQYRHPRPGIAGCCIQGCNTCWGPWACCPWQARKCCHRGWEACQGRSDAELFWPYYQACCQEVSETCPACFVAEDRPPDASRQGFGASWPRGCWQGPLLVCVCVHGQITPEAGWQAQGDAAPG